MEETTNKIFVFLLNTGLEMRVPNCDTEEEARKQLSSCLRKHESITQFKGVRTE